ncbi:MAG: BON domain-containing protein [Pseudomonadota bacterium]
MKPFVATLLATALSAAFASAYAHNHSEGKPDTATYRTMTQKAAADYKAANAQCTDLKGNERSVCVETAKVARARADVDATMQYNNTLKLRTAARTALANAEYALAKAKCTVMTGADKDTCTATATSARTASLADAKADRMSDTAATGTTAAAVGVDNKGAIANTRTTDPTKAAAVDKCAQIAGRTDTGCLIDNKGRTTAATAAATAANRTENAAERASDNTRNAAATVANRTENATERAADKTRNAASTVAQKTENAAETVVQKTKEVARNVADKTERAVDNIAARTDRATDNAAARTDRATDKAAARTERSAEVAASKTGKVVADSIITTKVKADLFKEPELSAMAIHVETEKGVVMLSGFVDSKADADKAVRLAKSVEGVTQVKSAIKVK